VSEKGEKKKMMNTRRLFVLLLLAGLVSSVLGGFVTDPGDLGPGTLRDVLGACVTNELITFGKLLTTSFLLFYLIDW